MRVLQIAFENSSLKAQEVVVGAQNNYAPGLHNCVFGAYFRGALEVVALRRAESGHVRKCRRWRYHIGPTGTALCTRARIPSSHVSK